MEASMVLNVIFRWARQ